MKIARRNISDFLTAFGNQNGMSEESRTLNLCYDNRIKSTQEEDDSILSLCQGEEMEGCDPFGEIIFP